MLAAISWEPSIPALPDRGSIRSPVPSSGTLPDTRHPEKPEQSAGDHESNVLTDAPALQVIASSPSTLNSEHSRPLSNIYNDIPITPVILADDGPWMIGELHLHGQSYTRTPCNNSKANISPHNSPPEPLTSSQRLKLRKRKSQPTGKQPSKRARHPISSPEEDTSSSALYTHYLSASADEQLQFLSWLFQGAARRTFLELGTEISMNIGEKPAGEVDHPPSLLKHRGTSTRDREWSSEEVAFLPKSRAWLHGAFA
ncbi:uncharacterized protein BO87DRAFT_402459 [Aspergillus neoniger CBS 115656]|uniref:Uncharacterized protein n=1 Tax=Aspergillus neoniger (strain CBS 115656) TaxID=1448310 RepID=A0A318Y1F3_ASPNB|nr:hypothetical protein BO87DRAFT_402459 [Aspergillus neoniger CBS 115656]PYH28185.1 hypothetical protein BO87DRAFT_402459 [Aspergillus neoniger CBS 115656]